MRSTTLALVLLIGLSPDSARTQTSAYDRGASSTSQSDLDALFGGVSPTAGGGGSYRTSGATPPAAANPMRGSTLGTTPPSGTPAASTAPARTAPSTSVGQPRTSSAVTGGGLPPRPQVTASAARPTASDSRPGSRPIDPPSGSTRPPINRFDELGDLPPPRSSTPSQGAASSGTAADPFKGYPNSAPVARTSPPTTPSNGATTQTPPGRSSGLNFEPGAAASSTRIGASSNPVRTPDHFAAPTPRASSPPTVAAESSRLQPRVSSASSDTAPVGVQERRTQQILADMLTPHGQSKLVGSPVRLADVVATGSTREEQSERVEAYWALTSAAADYYLGLAEADELQNLRQRLPTYSTALSEEQAKQSARVATALRAAQVAQLRLESLTGRARPLPADTPFCGPYRTRFEQLFPGGGSGEAAMLHTLLPLRLAELQAAAEAIDRSGSWIDQVRTRATADDASGLLRALELLALNRRALVQLARDYNLQINRYTQLVAPERVDTPRLVAMLIRTSSTGAARSADDPLVAGFSTGASGSASRGFTDGAASRR